MYLPQCVITEENETLVITGKCFVTKEFYTVRAPKKGIVDWVNGEFIQNALPQLSVEDREFLISGTSPKGWDYLYPKEEEDA